MILKYSMQARWSNKCNAHKRNQSSCHFCKTASLHTDGFDQERLVVNIYFNDPAALVMNRSHSVSESLSLLLSLRLQWESSKRAGQLGQWHRNRLHCVAKERQRQGEAETETHKRPRSESPADYRALNALFTVCWIYKILYQSFGRTYSYSYLVTMKSDSTN